MVCVVVFAPLANPLKTSERERRLPSPNFIKRWHPHQESLEELTTSDGAFTCNVFDSLNIVQDIQILVQRTSSTGRLLGTRRTWFVVNYLVGHLSTSDK